MRFDIVPIRRSWWPGVEGAGKTGKLPLPVSTKQIPRRTCGVRNLTVSANVSIPGTGSMRIGSCVKSPLKKDRPQMWSVCPRRSEEEKEVGMAGSAADWGMYNVLGVWDILIRCDRISRGSRRAAHGLLLCSDGTCRRYSR